VQKIPAGYLLLRFEIRYGYLRPDRSVGLGLFSSERACIDAMWQDLRDSATTEAANAGAK
jgi:hypothetical protein